MTQDANQPNAPVGAPTRLEDVDLFSPGAQDHWFEAYPILHEQAPVHRIPGGGDLPGTDAFILSKYEDIRRVVRDPEHFPLLQDEGKNTSEIEREVIAADGFGDTVNARDSLRPDAEMQKRHRQELTDPWVGPTGAPRHEAMIRRVANELIDRFIDAGEVEFVSGFAAPLPQTVITTILGFPLEDMPMLRRWEEAQVRRFVHGRTHMNLMSDEEERENARALADFHRYIQQQIDRKRRQPGEDMTSFLIDVRYGPEQRRLTDGEIISVLYGMHIGGNETTQYALTAEAMLLAQDAKLMNTLRRERGKVRLFLEEALRLYSPTQGLSTRRSAHDVELRGVRIPKGSILHMRYGAGNRDADAFPNPQQVDLNRPGIGAHLAFSQGPRSCPGSALSRLEQNIAIDVLLNRLDRLELTPGRNDFRRQPGIMLGLYELHLSFSPAR